MQIYATNIFKRNDVSAFARNLDLAEGCARKLWSHDAFKTLWILSNTLPTDWLDMTRALKPPWVSSKWVYDLSESFPVGKELKTVYDARTERDVKVLATSSDGLQYIARVNNAYIDSDNVVAGSWGTVFDHKRMFLSAGYAHHACTDYDSRTHVRFKHYKALAVGHAAAYPTSFGHFLHEIVPIVVWLAHVVPRHVPIVMVADAMVEETVRLLGMAVPDLNLDRVLRQVCLGLCAVRVCVCVCL